MPKANSSLLWRYVVSVAMVAFAITSGVHFDVRTGPLLTVVLLHSAVILAAWYGGLGTGLVVTLLGALTRGWVISPPPVFTLGLQVYAFIIQGVMVAVLMEALHRERRKAECTASKLLDSEAKYRRFLEAASEGIVVLDGASRITYVNNRAVDLLGREEAALLGRRLSEFLGEPQPLDERVWLAAQTEVCFRRADATDLWALVSFTQFDGPSAADRTTLVFMTDVTQRRRAQEELKESEAVLRAFYDGAPMPMYVAEAEGDDVRIISANTAIARQLNLPAEQLRGRTASELASSPQSLSLWRPEFGASETTGGPVRFEYTADDPDSTTWVSATVSWIGRGPDGRSRFACLSEDITERRRAEAQIRRSKEAAEASERRYRSLAEAIPQIVWTARPDGTINYLNGRWTEYTGLSQQDGHGSGWLSVVHPADVGESQCRWEQVLVTGEGYEFEERMRRADGAYRWHLLRAVPLRDDDGQITGWFGTCTDIDDRKRAEQAHRFLVEAGKVLVSSLDDEATLVGVADLAVSSIADLCTIRLLDDDGHLNPVVVAHRDPRKAARARELFEKYPPVDEDLFGPWYILRSWQADFYPKISPPQLDAYGRNEEHRNLLRDVGYHSYIGAPLIARGRAIGVITFALTEPGREYTKDDLAMAEELAWHAALAIDNARLYREAQEALHCKDEAYGLIDTLFENAPVGLAFFDRDLRFVRINRALAEVSGRPVEDHLGRVVDEVLDADLAEQVRTHLLRVIERGEASADIEVHGRCLGSAGERRDWLVRHYPLRRSAGPPIGVGCVVLDITTRKSAERASREAKDLAEAANRAKDRFLAILSHELRTPLTPVTIALSSLLEGVLEPDLRQTLEMIRRNVALEARLIDDLLDLSRIARGGLRLEREVVDMHQTIRQALEVCRDEVLISGLNISLDFQAAEHHTRADHARLMQIVWNLVHNAVKFTPPGGTLLIRTLNPSGLNGTDSGSRVAVEFEDNGVGVDPEFLPTIFEPFERGEADRRGRTGGLGLGLCIGRSLAEAQGGSLTAWSRGRGLGTTFLLELPTVARPTAIPAPHTGIGNSDRPAPLRVLLVEDCKEIRDYLAIVLRGRGHDVETAACLTDARESLAGGAFDLVISDIELPDGTGLELGDLIAARGLPALAISGYGSEEDIRNSRDAGFAYHLTKPITLSALDEAICRVVATKRKGMAATVR